MQTKNFSTLIGTGIFATTLGAIAQPANAFVITNTSASWDNVTLNSGVVVGSDGVATDATNMVKFLDVAGQSQVRWGAAVNGGYYKDNFVQVPKQVKTYNRFGRFTGYKTVTETVNQPIWIPPTYEHQSGLGYKGVSNLDLDVGEIFNLGALTHFNQTIYTNNYIGQKSEFSLNLDFGESSIGAQTFNFAFSIDETLNKQAVCPYQTDAGKGCSDKITWDFAINEKNTFQYQNETYSLELVGFGSGLSGSTIVNEFISQENGNNSANLFARLVKVDTTQDIPEPASLLGLAALGLYFARSRKKQLELATVGEAV